MNNNLDFIRLLNLFNIGMNTCRICWKEIWKTYSDKKLRCSSCRKSVENAIWYNERTVEYVEDELYAWKSEYKKLKKENKKLNEENDRLKNNAMEDMRVQTKLEEENRKLRERNVKLTWWAISYNSVKERVEKQKEQIEKCKLTLLAINDKLIEEIFWED